MNLEHLSSYYRLVGTHADKSFTASIGVSIAGFCILAAAIARGIYWPSELGQSAIVAFGGVIAEFIGAAFLVLYKQALQQSKDYHRHLVQFQNAMIAHQFAQRENLPDEARATIVREICTSLMRADAANKDE